MAPCLQVYQDTEMHLAGNLEGSKLMRHVLGHYAGLGPDCVLFARKFTASTAQQLASLAAGYILPGGDIPA